MQGFKSFPDRTRIEFNHGSTVIVGPNGSGKSNITDAMRWVLGEISSKNIRGTKMEDVVFAGADGRNPMGYAEVSVTFENTDENGKIDLPYDEVTVTRRYYKAGESEYFINKRPVRLRDIHELFMNTGIGREGYSVIGQGRIAEIISRKSEERRGVFDEAAGISKYRHKRQDAERQLLAAEDNMLRVGDIITELEGRVGPLEREAERARKYLDLYERRRRADIMLSIFDSGRIRDEQQRADDEFRLSEHALEMITDTIDSLEAQSERLVEASQANKLSSERAYERIRELTAEISRLDGEYQSMKTDVGRSESQAAEYRANAEAAEKMIAAADAEAEDVKKALADAVAAYRDAEADLARKQEVLASLEGKLSEMTGRLEAMLSEQRRREDETIDLKVRLNVLRGSVADDAAKNASVSDEIAKYEASAAEYRKKADEDAKTVADFEDGIAKSSETIASVEEKLSGDDEKLAHKKDEQNAARAASVALSQRIDALVRLEDNFEGYGKAVKYVMDGAASGAIRGRVYGPVSRIITVPNEYITATETALGANLQNIVVDDEATAKEAIRYLQRGGAGRSTFYPVSAVRAQEPGREMRDAARFPGYIGIASELVSYDKIYDGVVRYLLGRTCVFDDLDHATEAARASGYKIRAVTLDGQQINAGGSFTGGSARRDSGMLTRSGEIKSLRAEKSLRDREGERLSADIAELERQRAAHKSEYDGERARCGIMETMMRAAMTSRDTAESQYEATVSLIAQLRADYEARAELSGRYETDMRELSEKCAAAESATAEIKREREELDVVRHDTEDERDAASSAVSEAMIEIARRDSAIEAARQLGAEKLRRREEYEELRRQNTSRADELIAHIADIEKRQKENRRVHGEAEAELSSVEGERAKLESGNMEFDARQVELRRKIREKTDEKETVVRTHMKNEQRKLALSTELDKMIGHLWEEYELTLTAAEEQAAELSYPAVTKENLAETRREVTECKNKLRALGSVNVGAIEEYKEVSERYEYLSRQMGDLRTAKDELTAIIEELERDMEKSFSEAFAKINTRFGEVFRELFGGGSAELYLVDPENVLTSGIEIKAAPPGKVIKNLSLLSGGEQAFVAIALLFAMIYVNPTPFCIFDEIESALDEVNVDRFAAYVRKYSDMMQFIIITHRRGTMETADSLYGITMPRHGISRVLTLDPGDMEAKEKYASDGAPA